jgi:hypothetical protein
VVSKSDMQFAVYYMLVETSLLDPQSSCCDYNRLPRLKYPKALMVSFQTPFELLLSLLRSLIDVYALILPNLRLDK